MSPAFPAAPLADIEPSTFEAACLQAAARQRAGCPKEALFWYQRALAFRPGSAEAYNNLGALCLDLGRQEDARRYYEAALALRPGYARPHVGLGTMFQGSGRYPQAAEHLAKALELDPAQPSVRYNLGVMLQFMGALEAASDCFREAQDALPDNPQPLSQYLLCLNYRPDLTGEELLVEHRRFGTRYPLPASPRHGNDPDPERPLRVGWLGVDFRQHLGSGFLLPVLENADRSRFSIHGYSALPAAAGDAYTTRFRELADGWTFVDGMSDAELDARIRADRIDVLLELAGHSGMNRLSALAAKPAPVQVTWLGYPNTTGLPAIDARLVDEVTDPQGMADAHASERLVRLPAPFLCFAPPADAPPVGPLPMLTNGYITFGSLNTFSKHTAEVLRLWARILAAVPDSRLLFKDRSFEHAEARNRVRAIFQELGITAERLILIGWAAERDGYLSRYGQIDIALDPFPYNGTITTCDALWMGVPPVTLPGSRHAARVGASLLSAVGLEDLIATDADDCVRRATALAHDPVRLAGLRSGMRKRLLSSPLCDARRFTANLETALRDLWRAWCSKATAPLSEPTRHP